MSTATSYNGWSVIDPGREVTNTPSAEPRLRSMLIPGTTCRLWIRDGYVALILTHWALYYNEKIQPIDIGAVRDDWGYAHRDTRGMDNWSCHASGTAIDLNALKHPMGKRGTFRFAWKVRRLHTRLAFYDGVIAWGGDYHGRPDEMHFEINKNYAAVRALALKLKDTPRAKRIFDANPGLRALIV